MAHGLDACQARVCECGDFSIAAFACIYIWLHLYRRRPHFGICGIAL